MNRHAEAMRDLKWSTLLSYTTVEACPIFQTAILLAGIPDVVCGTSITSLCKVGLNRIDLRAEEVIQRSP